MSARLAVEHYLQHAYMPACLLDSMIDGWHIYILACLLADLTDSFHHSMPVCLPAIAPYGLLVDILCCRHDSVPHILLASMTANVYRAVP
jgi:hypothetical protein